MPCDEKLIIYMFPLSTKIAEEPQIRGNSMPKQFKELLSTRFPDELKTWYRSPSRFVEELKKITPALQEEGIAVSVPPDTKLVTLAKQREVELS